MVDKNVIPFLVFDMFLVRINGLLCNTQCKNIYIFCLNSAKYYHLLILHFKITPGRLGWDSLHGWLSKGLLMQNFLLYKEFE